MGNRRKSAPTSGGRNWSGIAVAAGTLLAGLAAAFGVFFSQLGPGVTTSPSGPDADTSSGPPSIEPSTPIADASADPSVVGSIDALPGAVVRIEATGTFAESFDGGPEGIGQGAGFLVAPGGIVLTNSHVVTGAEAVTVWVGLDRTEYSAKVLGVSECSDLAVLEIDARTDLPYLDWFEGEIEPGLGVHAVGYPLENPEYTLKRGIVSQARGASDAPWASVDDAIEHDANILRGWSGGPVVTDKGQVVAINHAWNDATGQSVAVSRDEVRQVLPELQAGRDVGAIGLNGHAKEVFEDVPDPSDPAGIWVTSVEPDSPAARAGILAGDVVTELDGKPMAADGTMTEYCEILNEHQDGDTLSFKLYREESRETLRGAVDGDAVRPGFSFAVAVGGATSAPRLPAVLPTYSEDDRLSVDVPEAWADVEFQDWKFRGQVIGGGIVMSPDVAAFRSGWRTPGALIAASDALDVSALDDVLDAVRPGFDVTEQGSCTLVGRGEFTRGGYAGIYDFWKACRDTPSRFLTIAAEKADGSHVVYLQFQAAETNDLAILDRMLVTLEFDPN